MIFQNRKYTLISDINYYYMIIQTDQIKKYIINKYFFKIKNMQTNKDVPITFTVILYFNGYRYYFNPNVHF